jgi:hypothetical protein
MKKIVYLALFIGFALTNTSCNSDKKAQVINTFVKTYFPDAEVIANIKDGLDCEVTLSDYTQIGFDGNLFGKLEWDEVDCRHASLPTAVPVALVPVEITNYVNRIEGGQSITKIAKDNNGWDIELSNGLEIEFDKRFNVVDFDD